MALTFYTIYFKSSQLSSLLFGSKALFSIHDVLAAIYSTKRNKACRHHLYNHICMVFFVPYVYYVILYGK